MDHLKKKREIAKMKFKSLDLSITSVGNHSSDLKKKIRNRMSAQKSRDRQRSYITLLEKQNNELKEELLEIKSLILEYSCNSCQKKIFPEHYNNKCDFFSDESNSNETGNFTSTYDSPFYLDIQKEDEPDIQNMQFQRQNSSFSNGYFPLTSMLLVTFGIALCMSVIMGGADQSPNDRVKVLAFNTTEPKLGNLTRKSRLNKISSELYSNSTQMKLKDNTSSGKSLAYHNYKKVSRERGHDYLPVLFNNSEIAIDSEPVEHNRVLCQDCYFENP